MSGAQQGYSLPIHDYVLRGSRAEQQQARLTCAHQVVDGRMTRADLRLILEALGLDTATTGG